MVRLGAPLQPQIKPFAHQFDILIKADIGKPERIVSRFHLLQTGVIGAVIGLLLIVDQRIYVIHIGAAAAPRLLGLAAAKSSIAPRIKSIIIMP